MAWDVGADGSSAPTLEAGGQRELLWVVLATADGMKFLALPRCCALASLTPLLGPRLCAHCGFPSFPVSA